MYFVLVEGDEYSQHFWDFVSFRTTNKPWNLDVIYLAKCESVDKFYTEIYELYKNEKSNYWNTRKAIKLNITENQYNLLQQGTKEDIMDYIQLFGENVE